MLCEVFVNVLHVMAYILFSIVCIAEADIKTIWAVRIGNKEDRQRRNRFHTAQLLQLSFDRVSSNTDTDTDLNSEARRDIRLPQIL